MAAPISALYASLIGLLLLFLAFRVVKARRSLKIGLGSGGDKTVEHAMRVHANATEYAPIALIMIALLEINGGAPWLIHALGGGLVFVRLFHLQGFGSSTGTSLGRVAGTAGTWFIMVVAAVANLLNFFM
ncbi:MAG: MAPEG family protein [Pseudomonadota bacterium]